MNNINLESSPTPKAKQIMLLEESINKADSSDSLKLLGSGWQRKPFARKMGSRIDINIISPEGRRFRQYSELAKYLNRTRNKVFCREEAEQLKLLFSIGSLKGSIRKSVTKVAATQTYTKASIQSRKRERKILPKISNLTSQAKQLQCNSSQECQLIFLIPRLLQIPQKVTKTIILEPVRTNIKSNSISHQKENSMVELKSSIVASPNMFVSQDLNTLVDTELELTCNITDIKEKNDISHLCIHDPSYFDDFVLSKPKGPKNPSDERTEEHCDHNYLGKMSELEILDLYYNLDIQMSEETIQRMIDITKHLYEHVD